MAKKINLLDVKEALKDGRFRDSLPLELKDEILKFLDNPGCACNVPFYRKLMLNYKPYLQKYFPAAEVPDEAKEMEQLAQNRWSVINCKKDELEEKLKQLPPGRKQIEMARFQDEITVIVNELDFLY